MAVKVGERFRNSSGAELYGFMPADVEATVRQVDPNDEDSAHAGTLVLECDPDADGVGRSAGITNDELALNWERV
jgi:hypothetical protein